MSWTKILCRKVAFTQRNYIASFFVARYNLRRRFSHPRPFTFSKTKEKEKAGCFFQKMDFCRKKSLAGAFWDLKSFNHLWPISTMLLIKYSYQVLRLDNKNKKREPKLSQTLDVLSLLSVASKYWHNYLCVCKCTHDIFWLKKKLNKRCDFLAFHTILVKFCATFSSCNLLLFIFAGHDARYICHI